MTSSGPSLTFAPSVVITPWCASSSSANLLCSAPRSFAFPSKFKGVSLVVTPGSNSYTRATIFSLPLTMSSDTGAAKTQRILVPIGNGSEEIETSSAVDTFRRAGAQVTLASVEDSLTVTLSRGMKFVADESIDSVQGPFDAIALPGGMPGAERLRDSKRLIELLKQTKKSGAIVAAVCASPAVVFAEHGLLDNVTATCYPHPAFRAQVKKLDEAKDVVIDKDGQTITGTGPGTALKWALAIVEKMYGKDKADKLAEEMLVMRD